ncbi:MAG: hypothetical protein J07HX64_02938 [halophilic archaeon J07HX64]|nr:MAG: hypothetical protein J07HX64_02938 [halophilic archaeon J07HX64]
MCAVSAYTRRRRASTTVADECQTSGTGDSAIPLGPEHPVTTATGDYTDAEVVNSES